ncbi:MAG TPA: alpha/beta fold hydrolase [Ilumatobacteraceae bacterium]|nr:alpha/beta fold hydrolase [Ilumatobacteraceae bacterium]
MKPILLVHGAWHGGWSWAGLQAALDARGVPSYALDLPGHGASTEPFTDLHGDARHVAAAVDRLADRTSDEVVLVGHSYGGAVVSQAAAWTSHVASLVYVAAFVLHHGDSMRRITALVDVPEEPPSLLGTARRREGDLLLLDPLAAIPALYGNAPALMQHAAAARIEPQPVASFVQAVEGDGATTAPSAYVRCTHDLCVPLSHQDAMAASCTHVYTLAADHCPMLSAPDELAELLAAIATA